MPAPDWLTYFRPHPNQQIPAWFRFLVAILTGAGLSLSYTGFYLQIYSWFCLGLLLIVLFGARPRVAFFCGFLHGLTFCLTSVPWIAEVLSVHGGLSTAGGWGVLFLIAAAWGILIGTFAWAVNRIAKQSLIRGCVAAPFIWVTFEFVRAHLPEISFPWNLLGYPASSNLALLQLTSLTGIYGLTFLVAAFNALLAWADAADAPKSSRRVAAVAGAALVIIVVMLTGQKLVPASRAGHFARGVQLNFPEVESYPANWWDANAPDLREAVQLSTAQSPHHPDLIIWPEAPAPFSWQDPRFVAMATGIAQTAKTPFLVGVIEWKREMQPSGRMGTSPYNSALLLNASGQRVYSYDKIHLVPFGEYEPFPLIHRVVTSVSGEVGGFHKGKDYTLGTLPGDFKFGTFICYEAIYPGEIRKFAAEGANLLINISNDGWFGKSAAAEQHLHMARVRAVENRRWLLRVTNSGITASVDPYGRIYAPLPRDQRTAVDLPYDFRTDTSFYARFDDWFAWLCVLISIILVAHTFWKRPNDP